MLRRSFVVAVLFFAMFMREKETMENNKNRGHWVACFAVAKTFCAGLEAHGISVVLEVDMQVFSVVQGVFETAHYDGRTASFYKIQRYSYYWKLQFVKKINCSVCYAIYEISIFENITVKISAMIFENILKNFEL